MANDLMMAQMSKKGGFIAALDLGDGFFAAPEVLHRRCLEFLHAV